MKYEFVSPLYDYVFSEIFGNQRNIDNTKAFLETLLDIPKDDYDQLTVVNPVLKKMFWNKKSGVVDLKLTTKTGRIIQVELQVQKKSNLKCRILYYLARLIGDQLNWGDDFNKLKEVISIVICDHILLEEEISYINEYELRNRKNNSFTQLIKLITLELPKLPEMKDNSVWPWLQFFKCKKMEDYEMLAKKYPELEKPVSCVKRISLSERWKLTLLNMQVQQWDEINRIRQIKIDAREEGLAEGLAEGKAEGKIEGKIEGKLEVAKNALTEGLSVETIQTITGLDTDTIKNLLPRL